MTRPATEKSYRKGRELFDANNTLMGLRGRTVELPGYSGPLDLLLKLIRKNEVDIYDIPVAAITEQYLEEIEGMEEQDVTVAGDFVLMAATLIELKSAMMLPAPPHTSEDEAADPRADLVQRLLEYQAFQAAAEELSRLEARRRMLFGRAFAPGALTDYVPIRPAAPNLKVAVLHRSLGAIIERMLAASESVTSISREQIPLHLRIAGVMAELRSAGDIGLSMEELVSPYPGRLVIIVTFLALLELLRAGRITVRATREGYRFWAAALAPTGGGSAGNVPGDAAADRPVPQPQH